MLSFMRGKAVEIKPDRLVLEVKGFGFSIRIPIRVSQFIHKEDDVKIYTSLCLKEDSVELYGFLDEYEKELFEKLIKISGIGPATAMNILSTYDSESLYDIIEKEDIKALSKVPGVGKKTAQRILLELRGILPSIRHDIDREYEDILSALLNLGFKKTDAKEALEKAYSKDKDEASIIKECLALLAGKYAE